MNKILYGKRAGWVAPVVMLFSLFAVISAQPGFLSINCGSKTNHIDAENNIKWVTDAGYIDVGESADIGRAASYLGSYLHSLRIFPKPLNKSCYKLPVARDVPHLVRLWFDFGNFIRFQNTTFAFSIETVDMLYMQNITYHGNTLYYENILVTSGTVLYICLVRTLETDDPFISAIELRTLQDGMYRLAKPGTMLVALSRHDVCGNSLVRYPQDKFDRIWNFDALVYSQSLSSKEPISTNNTENLPPTVVMQTACALNNSDSIPLPSSFLPTLLMLYFAEMETHISRSFLVMIDGVVKSTVTTNYSASEATIQSHGPNGVEAPNGVELVGSNSALPPIINAYEYYGLVQSDRSATDPDDIDALDAIKRRFDIKEWISPDPCYLIPWDGIGCYDDFEYFEFNRISDLDLSGRNLTGSVPDDIGQLTSLVNMSLNNNHLTGPIPNLTNLSYTLERLYLQDNNLDGTLEWLSGLRNLEELSLDNNHFTGPWPNLYTHPLERLYLQNNNLNGTVEWLSELTNLKELSLGGNHLTGPMPNLANLTRLERLYLQNNRLNGTVEWLYELRNLKELNIENNNFSGAIPVQLLLNCSLKLSYSGNPYLRMDTRECNHTNNHENNDTNNHENNDTNNHKNKHTKLMVVLGILLFIALTVADQVVKLKIKREGVATESSEAKMEPEYSMVIVPNPTKSRAFTRDEIIAATQNFSRDIGRGGFGSVFFGLLPDENVIAVKVLSLFSRQGIHEFLNEVDILSKINHKNLVSLLGYCNETKEVMLIYEHMSGGSLRDHLYGSSAENSDLSWKRRLKIALDAAQGLEYLHVSCTPKIIHRDIKTSNILLDSNFNGKLADFGLSKMTIDGEATHVTTAVKGTFGYLDPEYYNTQMLTEKSDVYSFGVVLLEIICGRQPIDIKLPEEAVNIIRWVTPYLLELNENGGKIIEIIDKSLCGGYDMRSMTRVARIAMRCVEAAPSCRPSVSEVVAELKEAIKVEDKVSISVAEEIGAQNGDLLAGTADSTKREGMEWSDNSTNISKVGR